MPSALFPSGDWYGFYTYHGHSGRHPMDIRFTFENGRISACGGDPVGEFTLTGAYDEAARECHWTKQYLGAHAVFYRGFREGKGIWGTWDLRIAQGGFHIWPVGVGDGVEHEVEEEASPVRVGAPRRRADVSDQMQQHHHHGAPPAPRSIRDVQPHQPAGGIDRVPRAGL